MFFLCLVPSHSSHSDVSFYHAVPFIITSVLTMALILLLDPRETLWVIGALVLICVLVPVWKYVLQGYKVQLRGPWDIAHV